MFSAGMPFWSDEAACSQYPPDLWFDAEEASAADLLSLVKRVCRSCPIQQECLDYAENNGEKSGIWGGLTTAERGNNGIKHLPILTCQYRNCYRPYHGRRGSKYCSPSCSKAASRERSREREKEKRMQERAA